MSDAALASLVARRLAHDFAGPLGALGAALDMLGDGADAELVALAKDSSDSLQAQLRLLRFALAPAATPVAGETARALVADWLRGRDGVTLDWDGDGDWPAGVAELTAGLAMVAAEAGRGALTVRRGAVTLGAATLHDGMAAVLAGGPATTTRHAIAALLAAQAAALGMRIDVETGDGLTLRLYQGSDLPV